MPRPCLLILLAAALAALLAPAPASATTFCVADWPCQKAGGSGQKDLASALAAAASPKHPGADVVRIGPGEFFGVAGYAHADPVEIVGAGRDATRLVAPQAAAAGPVLDLAGAAALARDLEVELGTAPGAIGIRLSGGATARRVDVHAGAGATNAAAVVLDGGRLEDAIANAEGEDGAAVRTTTAPGSLVERAYLVGHVGVRGAGPAFGESPTRIRGTRIEPRANGQSRGAGVHVQRGHVVVQGSVIDLSQSPDAIGLHVQMPVGDTGLATLGASQVTIFGPSATASGVIVHSADKQSLAASVADSIVAGALSPGSRMANGGHATLGLLRVNLPAGRAVYDHGHWSSTGSLVETAITTLPVAFADAAHKDFRLAPGSPLVDRGAVAPLTPGAWPLDAAGTPRAVDGDGDCVPRTDLGAYEQVPAATRARAAASVVEATPGEVVAFSAAGSCDPVPGVAATLRWTFDDGAVAEGESVSRAFSTPGPHTATLQVLGEAGRAASAAVTVTVRAPGPGPGPGGGPGGGPGPGSPAPRPADTTAPALRRLTVTRRGAVRFQLSEPARVRLTLERCVRPRRAACQAWKTVRAGSLPVARAGAVRARIRVVGLRGARARVLARATDAAGNRGRAVAARLPGR